MEAQPLENPVPQAPILTLRSRVSARSSDAPETVRPHARDRLQRRSRRIRAPFGGDPATYTDFLPGITPA
jgi:hypothetical protein